MSPYLSQHAIGSVVASRYRLVSLIGQGPFATVYLADDVKLRRRVAIKVMDGSLAQNAAFVETFQREVHAAGALRHPHIAVIHDWGLDGDVFLASEFLEFGSLRQLIDNGGRLTLPQALQVGLGAARALAFAHEHVVVHRDVQPSNLLFGSDGRLRIADFGLARAFAQAATTAPTGVASSALRYATPEQAQGHNIDGRADVYALAICLIEAVTGEVPFLADTAVATLLARVGRTLDVPDSLGALQEPLLRAGADDPAQRLDASEFATALMAVAERLDEPEPIVFDSAGDVPVQDLTYDDITLVVTPQALEADRAHIAATSPVAEATASSDPVEQIVSSRSTTPGQDDASEFNAHGTQHGVSRRRWRRAWLALVVVIVVGGGTVGGLVWRAQQIPRVVVPQVDELPQSKAAAALEGAGFTVKIRHERRDGSHAGDVLATEPAAGAKAVEGSTIALVVSSGQSLVTLPEGLVGNTFAVAKARLDDRGLHVATPQKRYSEDVKADVVLAVEKGTPARLEKGSKVTLIVSKGPRPRIIPSVANMTPDQAAQALRDVGLVPRLEKRYDTKVDTGGLVGLEPAPGTSAPRGATVTVIESKGLLVAVPELGGISTVAGAIAKLEAAGLVANNLTGTGNLSGTPAGFDPPAGQLVVKGSRVNIVVR